MIHQTITTFAKKDDMCAHELQHQQTFPISVALASLVVRELGSPSFRDKSGACAWYANAYLNEHVVPFALRSDHNGRCSLVCGWDRAPMMNEMLEAIIPNIQIIDLPVIRGVRRT